MSAKFLRFNVDGKGERSGFVYNNEIYDITDVVGTDFNNIIKDGRINDKLFLDGLKNSTVKKKPIGVSFQDACRNQKINGISLRIPIFPPEVWGVGVTYKKNRDLHEEDLKVQKNKYEGLYDYVYNSTRPEIFFKALPHHCVGPHEDFTIRKDSSCTIVEAELACVLNKNAEIVAFTAANDITAWDIELECPLFLNYAKIFNGGCFLGPSLVPAIELENPLSLDVTCMLFRDGKQLFVKKGNTKNLKRKLDELTKYLTVDRSIQDGAVLCTGTAVGIPSDLSCKRKDIVSIDLEEIGLLINKAK